VAVTFFGRDGTFPDGPATLGLHTDSPIIPGLVRRWPRGRHEARLLDHLPWPPPGRSGEAIRALTQQIASAFERVSGREPSQWAAFHRLPAAVPGWGR
ncbi:MAG: hypothetical protein ACP5PW_09400, partial [Candidatus Dormibacteria bacterium]